MGDLAARAAEVPSAKKRDKTGSVPDFLSLFTAEFDQFADVDINANPVRRMNYYLIL
ncbi:hypothetical protein [Chamaesiphon sp.]|uniref:hypothetical protein n=1 Tax=Chamaesiphon sp. TaxID=2814140 RepID=UPI0035945E01